MWPRCFVRPHFSTHVKEKIVNKVIAMLIGGMLGLGASLAHADDTATKPKAARTATTLPAAAVPAEPVKVSQQEKMRLCSKQATGKKGAERKDFMKACLSKKA